ncbi:hypothetical protein O0L34_g5285 [Tuta absoluta]|nr:hypothetical protein O0L34_g5285 [Tuta absoluta]
MFLSQLGICTVRIIFVADNLRDMFDAADSSTSLKFMIIPTLLLEVLMHNIRIISYIINGANAINIVGIILVIVQIFRGPRREIHLFPLGWVSVLVSIGTYLFNLCAVGVVLSCEKALEDPHIMSSPFGVVPVGLMVPTLINILIGTLGYWAYGVMDENILKYMAFDDPVTMAAHGLFSVSAIMGYPIFCYPGVQIIIEVIVNHDRNINIQPQSLKEVEFFARPIFVLLTFAIAYFKPYQGSLIAFVGCGCTSVLLLVLPALMEICLYYPNNYGRYHYILLKDLLIVAIGMVIWVGGLYTWAYLWYVSHSKFTEDTGMRFYLISE